MSERRVFPRIDLKEPVQFQVKSVEEGRGALSCDISEGGVRVKLNDFVPIGAELILQVRLNSGQVVECVGRVKWVSQIPFMDWYQAGVEFENTDAIKPIRNRIHQYTDQKA